MKLIILLQFIFITGLIYHYNIELYNTKKDVDALSKISYTYMVENDNLRYQFQSCKQLVNKQ